jgi:hypothetical protein
MCLWQYVLLHLRAIVIFFNAAMQFLQKYLFECGKAAIFAALFNKKVRLSMVKSLPNLARSSNG